MAGFRDVGEFPDSHQKHPQPETKFHAHPNFRRYKVPPKFRTLQLQIKLTSLIIKEGDQRIDMRLLSNMLSSPQKTSPLLIAYSIIPGFLHITIAESPSLTLQHNTSSRSSQSQFPCLKIYFLQTHI